MTDLDTVDGKSLYFNGTWQTGQAFGLRPAVSWMPPAGFDLRREVWEFDSA